MGVTSLLTIMAVLLLTSFAALSLLAARSDLSLSNEAAQAISGYYKADGEAEEWLMRLCEFSARASSGGGLRDALEAAGYSVEAVGGALIVRASFIIDEWKNLEVAVSVEEGGIPAIVGWQSAPVYGGSGGS
jgi:hypothetical protein